MGICIFLSDIGGKSEKMIKLHNQDIGKNYWLTLEIFSSLRNTDKLLGLRLMFDYIEG